MCASNIYITYSNFNNRFIITKSILTNLNNFINALEDSFTIDENLTLNSAINTLWNLRGIDFDSINKLSLPTSPYELQDGRQVLIISKNFTEYAQEVGLLDS